MVELEITGVVGVSVAMGVVAVVEGELGVVAWPVVVAGDAATTAEPGVAVSGVVERGPDVDLGGADVVIKGAVVETGGVEMVHGVAEVVEMSGGQLHCLSLDFELTSG